MKPWQAFGLSLLAALSLHAVILLVPRIAGPGDPGPPMIKISLDSAYDPGSEAAHFIAARRQGAGPISPPVMRPASPFASPAAPASPNDGTALDSRSSDGAPKSAAAVSDARASTGPETPTAAPASIGSEMDAAAGRFGRPGGVTGAQGEAPPGAAAATTSVPRPRGEILPVYPRNARSAGWEGVVTISALIDETGRVVSAVVRDSSGHQSLDRAALEAVKRTRFEPAVRDAQPVSSPLLIPVRFKLN